MAMWKNADGLWIKFGRDEAATAVGGEVQMVGNQHVIEFDIDYTDALSATATILNGSVDADVGFGVLIPKGAVPMQLEVWVEEAFTSSGTIGSATLVIGTKQQADRSTEIDHDGLTTTSFVGSVLDGAGEYTVVKPGVTGAGDDYGVVMAANGLVVVANSAHASHPFTAGKARCRLVYTYTVGSDA